MIRPKQNHFGSVTAILVVYGVWNSNASCVIVLKLDFTHKIVGNIQTTMFKQITDNLL